MQKILTALQACPMLAGKNAAEIETLASQIQYRIAHYKKNELIFAADQPADHLGIIVTGRVEVQKELASGKVIKVLCKNIGDVFGGAALFANHASYNCSILARENSSIMLIAKEVFLDILCRDPQIVSNILTLFGENVLFFDKKIELLSYSSIQQKIAFSLLNDLECSEDGLIHLPYTKQSWAEHLNVSRPSLCRELKNLDNNGIIDLKASIIRILKKDALEAILGN